MKFNHRGPEDTASLSPTRNIIIRLTLETSFSLRDNLSMNPCHQCHLWLNKTLKTRLCETSALSAPLRFNFPRPTD